MVLFVSQLKHLIQRLVCSFANFVEVQTFFLKLLTVILYHTYSSECLSHQSGLQSVSQNFVHSGTIRQLLYISRLPAVFQHVTC